MLSIYIWMSTTASIPAINLDPLIFPKKENKGVQKNEFLAPKQHKYGSSHYVSHDEPFSVALFQF